MDKKENNNRRLTAAKDNAQVRVDHYKQVIGLLLIRKVHFIKLSTFFIFPAWLKAYYKLKCLDIDRQVEAKRHFLKIYEERINSSKYAECVLDPDLKNS